MTEVARPIVEPIVDRRPTALELFAGVGGFHLAPTRRLRRDLGESMGARHQGAARIRLLPSALRTRRLPGARPKLQGASQASHRRGADSPAINRDIAEVLDDYEPEVEPTAEVRASSRMRISSWAGSHVRTTQWRRHCGSRTGCRPEGCAVVGNPSTAPVEDRADSQSTGCSSKTSIDFSSRRRASAVATSR